MEAESKREPGSPDQASPRHVRWLDWSDAAFRRAREEGKPILLDISAVWCHWCHRLDSDTYSVPDIVNYIEEHFIPIRVDTDKRPDINRRYNMGGWPTTAFLTPEGQVIGGGTYIPPDRMRQVLRDIRAIWDKSVQSKPALQPEIPHPERIPAVSLSPIIIEEVLGEVLNNFDPIYGGFGSQPKFPNTEAHELALIRFSATGNQEFLKIVTTTLRNVGKSGTYDREMGGFFRYSTVKDWSIPHFEKMCEDNAKWLQLYLHAYQLTGDPFYTEIAEGIIDYVNTWLSDQSNGCFFGSQDADEEYYGLARSERMNSKPPFIDRNIYTNWNALMISAYLQASFVLGRVTLRQFAMKSLDQLLALNYAKGEGMYHFYDRQPQLPNQLIDQVQTVRMLTDAYEATGDRWFVAAAEELMQVTVAKLYDAEHGGFFDTVVNPEAPGFLSRPVKPLDENSLMALTLSKLYHITGKEIYRKMAEETLKRFVQIYPQFGFMAADYAIAVDAMLNPPTTIRIVGRRDKAEVKAFIAESQRIYVPRRVIQFLDLEEDRDRIAELGYHFSETPAAYVCVGNLCTAPITEPKEVPSEIGKLASGHLRVNR